MGLSWSTPSKLDKIYPFAIPNQISTISMYIPSLVKIHWCLLKLSSRNEKWACLGRIRPSKFDELGLLAIPNQISTISMHIPELVKIHWSLLKLSSGKEIQMDRHTDIQYETIIPRHYRVAGTIIPHHYRVAGYKNKKNNSIFSGAMFYF